MKLVVLSLDSLGDLVLRQPFVKSLMDRGDEITLVIQERNRVLMPYWNEGIQFIGTDIYPYASPDESTWQKAEILLDAIKKISPEGLIVAPFSRTYLDNWLIAQMRDIPCYGFSNVDQKEKEEDETLISHSFPIQQNVAEVKKNAYLYEKITGKSIESVLPELVVPKQLITEAEKFLAVHELQPFQYVLGAPAGVSNVSLKCWPEESFIQSVLHVKKKHGLNVLLTGSIVEENILQRISYRLSQEGCHVQIWIGDADSFGFFLALIKLSCFYLGTDSGPMHFSAALNKPVVTLFGGGTWPRFLPAARRAASIAKELPCYGCMWNCFLGEAVCLSMVSVKQITEGIDWILSDALDEVKIFSQTADLNEISHIVRLGQANFYCTQITHIQHMKKIQERANVLEGQIMIMQEQGIKWLYSILKRILKKCLNVG